MDKRIEKMEVEKIVLYNTTVKNPTGQKPRRGKQNWENAPVPPTTASGWDKRSREGGREQEEEEEDKDEGWWKMKDESPGAHLTGSYAIRSESKLIYTSVQMEDDELLMERCVDSLNAGLLCVGLLK